MIGFRKLCPTQARLDDYQTDDDNAISTGDKKRLEAQHDQGREAWPCSTNKKQFTALLKGFVAPPWK